MARTMGNSYKMIPVRPSTWKRLRDYRMGAATFDEVLNELMDNVPLEVFSKKLIEEHYKRMRTFEGRSWRMVKEKYNKK